VGHIALSVLRKGPPTITGIGMPTHFQSFQTYIKYFLIFIVPGLGRRDPNYRKRSEIAVDADGLSIALGVFLKHST
jgi:hypothetical protein